MLLYFSQELTSLLSQSRSEKDKILVLKAMGNMGSKELIVPAGADKFAYFLAL